MEKLIRRSPVQAIYALASLILLSFALASCAQNATTQPQVSYIAVDRTKYKTPEAMQTDLAQAKYKCSAPKHHTDYQTGRNVVSAIKASNDELSSAAFDACMAERGFLRQN